ncbi:MAG: class I SAM-dependent methyltransferase [Bacteroidetes bacterium]|nr:class I SAM-dependent methyltransferase [Bacteroidota bacterium]
MKPIYYFLLILTPIFIQCKTQTATTKEVYTYKIGDRYGTGKWYKGREIANVMGFQGMSWLERPEREREENTFKLLNNMDIEPNDVIADIGSGSGYHVFKMAPIARNGQVFAVDIQEEMLAVMREKIATNGMTNVSLIQGTENSTNLPENSIDKVLLVDVYHEFSFPVEMLASIKKALKPNGSIFLIEYRGEDLNVPIKKVHKMTEKQAIKEWEAAGFQFIENISNLPWQHCMVFQK